MAAVIAFRISVVAILAVVIFRVVIEDVTARRDTIQLNMELLIDTICAANRTSL